MPITQDNRILSISTPLGKDFLLIHGFTAREEISRPFTLSVDLLHQETDKNTPPTDVAIADILGKNVIIEIIQRDDTTRHFNGIVNRFTQKNRDENFTFYQMEVVPQFWLLTQVRQSRIFQEKSVPDILNEVLSGTNFKLELQGTYKPRNYCVQYRESDFDFASRLMEEEGIFYFFEHDATSHNMIIADTPSSHRDCPSKSTIEFVEETSEEEHESSITHWVTDYQLQTGKVTFWDNKFELPGKKLNADKPSRFNAGNNQQLELYDYPGGYARKFDGIDKSGGERAADLQNIEEDNKRKAEITVDALDAKYKTISGSGDCGSMAAGHRFDFVNHPTNSVNGKYVITAISHSCSQSPDYISESVSETYYSNSFECISLGAGTPPFRPLQMTRKPTVHGSQTALVVGPSGEEIFTDKYGRVKVQFHWDRHGANDSSSSCWVRVAQIAAGNKWGAMFIPRIGWEVVVDFLEGDPDQPIIVGSVYNAGMMPPYTLPDEKTKSTIKSNSSKGGGGFNEFRIEDKKGEEQIFIHAEKDMDVRVKNDKKEIVLNEKHTVVKSNQFSEGSGDSHAKLSGDKNEEIGGSASLKVGSDIDVKAGGKVAVDATGEIHIKSGMKVVIEAGVQVSLKAGGSFVDIGPSGVTISGAMVLINSGGSAGSGGGSSPTAPTAPKEAVTADPGDKAAAPGASPAPPAKPDYSSPAAAGQQGAANNGTPATSPSSGDPHQDKWEKEGKPNRWYKDGEPIPIKTQEQAQKEANETGKPVYANDGYRAGPVNPAPKEASAEAAKKADE